MATASVRGPAPGPPLSVAEVAWLTGLMTTFRQMAKVIEEVDDGTTDD